MIAIFEMWYIYVIKLFCLSGLYGRTTLSSEINKTSTLDILVLIDLSLNGVPCSTSDVETYVTEGTDGLRVVANITWIPARNSFDLILKVRDISSGVCDIIIIDTSRKIFEHASAEVQVMEVQVLHWPSHERIWNAVPPYLSARNCFGVNFTKEAMKNENRDNVADNWKTSSLMASIIQRAQTDNLFVIIQYIKDSNIYFDEAVLDRIPSKYAIYHDPPSHGEGGIRTLLNRTASNMNILDWSLIICNETGFETIVTELKSLHHRSNTDMRHFSKWLIFADDQSKSVIQNAFRDITNVAFVSISNEQRRSCKRQMALKTVIDTTLYQLSCNLMNTPDTSTKYKFGVLYQMFVRKITDQNYTFSIETLPWHAKQRRFSHVSYVSNHNTAVLKPQVLFPNTRYGFNNRELTVATLPWFTFTVKVETNGTVAYQGFCMDILDELARSLNFSYTIIEPEDQQWGKREAGNKWTGLVGLLQRREVDMVAAVLNIDNRREEVMDFTTPFYFTYITGLFQKPDPNKQKWKTLIKPFRYENYIVLSVVFISACGVLFATQKAPKVYKEKQLIEASQSGFVDVCFQLIGVMLYQGHPTTPESISGRTFMAFFGLFTIIIAALYNGTLMSFLAVTKELIPFTTFDELLNQDDFKWGSLGGSIHMTSFSESDVGTIKQLWRGMQKFHEDDPSVMSANQTAHMEKVKAGEYVFIAGFNDLLDLGCDLMTLKEILYQNYYGFGLQSNSPFNQIISRRLATISENGMQRVWEKKWTANKEKCDDSVKAESRPITLTDIQSAFYLLGLGTLLSVVVLIFETGIGYCIRRARKNRPNEPTY